MQQYLVRGALIEYGSDFLGPIPNVVIFQFNPESLNRVIRIPPRPPNSRQRATGQAGDVSTESIALTAHFSAADQLNSNNPLARVSGIGPQLSALEKMVYPTGAISGVLGEALDAVGDLLSGGADDPTQPVPREQFPRLLFIWGLTRVLPVAIASMSINEKQFDNLLNPIQAEVSLSLLVSSVDPCSTDPIGQGALEYSNLARDAMAVANLANTAEQAVDLIPLI
jgi:hypothetical protein